MITPADLADLTLTAALGIAVIALWRKLWQLNDQLLSYHAKADAQREQLLKSQEKLASNVRVWRADRNDKSGA